MSAGGALRAVRSYGDNPSAFLALNAGTEHFEQPGSPGVIAYRRAGRYLIQFGGPFAPAERRLPLLTAFLAHARERRCRVAAVQIQGDDARLYAAHGFTVNQIGASYAVDLARFTLRGSRFMRLRNKISRARRSDLTVAETDPGACGDELAVIDRAWLAGKGRGTRELRFLVGAYGDALQEHRRMFVARIGGRAVGYISYSPVFGRMPGWMHDLSRRHPQAPPGVMEAVNLTAVERFQAEECAWLHFGFTPFTGLDPAARMPGASRLTDRLVALLAEHGDRVYPARSQLAYKEKWGPHEVLPEYAAFHGGVRPGAVWHLLRATNAI
jgi:lysylphosphatidylglycerol synthetase-like protein (DUF2156 family)